VAYGQKPAAVVSFAETSPRPIGVSELWEYASEEGNPGNLKHVTGILMQLPSPRLREGVVFVDTPGVGSLATSGAAEALAYLPRCDLGIVLIDAAAALGQDDLALLRALYEAGVPAMVVLSKSDLLTPSDRKRMMDYIREQLGRELGLDLTIHPVSVIGADESLLIRWFESEVGPLLDRHRALTEASIRRKIAGVRESVVMTLETLLARRRGGGRGAGTNIDSAAAHRLLDAADAAIRQTRDQLQDLSADRDALLDLISHVAAEVLVAGCNDQPEMADGPLAVAARDVLTRRARSAHGLITELHEALVRALDELHRSAPLANADVASLKEMRFGGLPAPDLEAVQARARGLRPWWTPLFSRLAIRAVRSSIKERFGAVIREWVEFYNRRLGAWTKGAFDHLVEQYDSQAASFREQIRRLSAEMGDVDPAEDTQDLAADLRELQ
jgi:hypothetical protein